MRKIIPIILFLFLLGCMNENRSSDSKEINTDILGTYYNEGYEKREEGYDWVAITISGTKDQPYISVSSRKDKKKQTCSLVPTLAEILNPNQLKVSRGENEFLVELHSNKKELTVNFIEFERRFELMSFCSGGGTLVGRYRRN